MPKIFDEETHLPLNDPDYQVISDDKLPDEDYIPREELYSFDEFNEHYVAPTINENHRDRIKKMFLKPVISLVLLGAVVLASYGIDPLGKNMLVNNAAVAPAENTGDDTISPGDETVNGGDETEAPDETEEDTTEIPIEDEDEFPALGNLNPDFAGDYAWSGDGSEEYVRFIRDGDTSGSYLVKGGAWDVYDAGGQVVTPADAVYDRDSNTLTLNGFNASLLDVNLMGNGFTIRLEGDNHIGTISVWGAMYAGSVTFEGNGSLTVDNGITLNCEGSQSCMIVKKGVTLDISGDTAIGFYDTTMDQPLYLSKSLSMTGGDVVGIGENEYEGNVYYSYTVGEADGTPSAHVVIKPN